MRTKRNNYSLQSQSNAAVYYKDLDRVARNFGSRTADDFFQATKDAAVAYKELLALGDSVDFDNDEAGRAIANKVRRATNRLHRVCAAASPAKLGYGSGDTLCALAGFLFQGSAAPLTGHALRFAQLAGY